MGQRPRPHPVPARRRPADHVPAARQRRHAERPDLEDRLDRPVDGLREDGLAERRGGRDRERRRPGRDERGGDRQLAPGDLRPDDPGGAVRRDRDRSRDGCWRRSASTAARSRRRGCTRARPRRRARTCRTTWRPPRSTPGAAARPARSGWTTTPTASATPATSASRASGSTPTSNGNGAYDDGEPFAISDDRGDWVIDGITSQGEYTLREEPTRRRAAARALDVLAPGAGVLVDDRRRRGALRARPRLRQLASRRTSR